MNKLEKNQTQARILSLTLTLALAHSMFIKGITGVGSHPKLHTYEEGYLLPVLKGDELLFSHRHKGLLRQLRDLAELPNDDFDISYNALVTHFMEFVQILPHKANGILGSLLNYSLARAISVFQKYCQIRKNQTTPLFKFAVFSAALLKDVGRVISNQRIIMVDNDGNYINDWNPFSGSMVGVTEFFKMYPISSTYLRIETEATPLLARQLISPDVFLWLSSDLAVFSDWLAALLNEEGVGSKEITWALSLIKRDDILAILNTLDGAEVDKLPPILSDVDNFHKWLKEGIEKGDIPINTDDAMVHVVNEGVFIERRLFKYYIDLYRLPVDYAKLCVLYGNSMGIASKGGTDFIHAFYLSPHEHASFTTFAGTKNRSSREGLVADSKLLFKNKIPENSSVKPGKYMVPENHKRPIIFVKPGLDLSKKQQ